MSLTSHRTSHTHPEPMLPRQVYELRIDLKFVAYFVPAGHALRFSMASADLQNAWPCSSPAVHTLQRGADFPSRVVLPLADADAPQLPPPAFKPSPHREPTERDHRGSSHKLTHDLVNETVTVELERNSGLMPNSGDERPAFGETMIRREARSRYTVSRKDPAAARMHAEHSLTITRPEGEIRLEANESLASDAQMFRFQSQVDIRVDGKPHFTKSWRASRPRLLD
ncbi:MAG: CocE/NonD family hydrolase C-terminal non-catalytic domain-containing protein [Chloroflexota bacterium]